MIWSMWNEKNLIQHNLVAGVDSDPEKPDTGQFILDTFKHSIIWKTKIPDENELNPVCPINLKAWLHTNCL